MACVREVLVLVVVSYYISRFGARSRSRMWSGLAGCRHNPSCPPSELFQCGGNRAVAMDSAGRPRSRFLVRGAEIEKTLNLRKRNSLNHLRNPLNGPLSQPTVAACDTLLIVAECDFHLFIEVARSP